MKKLLFLLLSFLSHLNAMHRITVRNNTPNVIEIGQAKTWQTESKLLTLSPGQSKQLCHPSSTITMYTKGRGVDSTPTSFNLDKETTLVRIDSCRLTLSHPIQIKSRPLIICNETSLAILLAIRRPGYGIWQDNISCPAQTDSALNIAADADHVEIYFPSNPELSGPNFSSELEDHIFGLEVRRDDGSYKLRRFVMQAEK
jgi:hypothetical protein